MSRGGATPTPTPEPVVIENWIRVTNSESPAQYSDAAIGLIDGVAGTPFAILHEDDNPYNDRYLILLQTDSNGSRRTINDGVGSGASLNDAIRTITNLSDTPHQAIKAYEGNVEQEVIDYMWQFMPEMISISLAELQTYWEDTYSDIDVCVVGTFDGVTNPCVNIRKSEDVYTLTVKARRGIWTADSRGKTTQGAQLTEQQLVSVGNAILAGIPTLGELITSVESSVGVPQAGVKYKITSSFA